MEFPFSVNNLLGSTISKLDNTVTPFRKNADGYDARQLRRQLMEVIDRMGEASARAQGLRTIITTGRKLELSDHILYVMRDDQLNDNKGAVIGILKIGNKKLFVYDTKGRVHEMEPMCVLDFYVHESRQRMGCGKLLFEYFLKDQDIDPRHLAIDKPSFKFSQFLKKHYNLKAELPQVNNFVVYEGFFSSLTSQDNSRGRRGYSRPPLHPNTNYNNSEVKAGRRQGSSHYRYRNSPSSQLESDTYEPSNRSSPRRGENMTPEIIPTPPRAPSHTEVLERLLSEREGSGGRGSRHSQNRNQNAGTNGDRSPPLLQREPPINYQEKMNLHQDYMGRNGHLKVTKGIPSSLPSINNHQSKTQYSENPASNILAGIPTPWKGNFPSNSNWTVYGAPNNYQTIGSRHYNHTRLW
ncbi:alpha-tubulin N-acetyltransferase-like isoform X2 [Crassostrea angulata]|uniref:Alpha-tubulin N-acetyltransferase n=1 Tax=Magallana gigas TaxID=29159 RepID=K1QKW6_MAGGI|nr:alpha-tubulin N-acetyltransferase-like isoform X2 [Crassostrea angulata]|eukprot:XP_011439251.1 PREDICTED: alpha-tubulin N-acetyltransferase isoform X2 [Crassostrea gigas]